MVLACLSFSPKQAEAAKPVLHGVELELPHFAFHNYGIGGALGGRLNFPLTHHGLIRGFSDRFALSIGLDAYYTKHDQRYGGALGVPIVLHWGLYPTSIFSIYFELGVNVFIHDTLNPDTDILAYVPSWIMGAFGMKFHLTRRFAINLRFGSPYSSIGLSFML